MYATGMSNKDIHDQIEEIYGVKISLDMVTAITDKIIPEIQEWKQRQLAICNSNCRCNIF